MQSFRENFFTYTLAPLIVVMVVVAYVRFMVLNDYVVAYESDCDPYVESCFVGCEDDECTQEYYYSWVQKYAPNVEAQCGIDITDCDVAYECLPEDGDKCEIIYCNPTIDGKDSCETLTESDSIGEELEDFSEEEANKSIESLIEVEGEEDIEAKASDGTDSKDLESSMEINLETTYDL